jgi:DnaK suppressor protein
VDQAKLEDLRVVLEGERGTVDRQLADYAGPDLGSSGEEGFSDSAHATAERDELLLVVEQLQMHKDELGAALDRIHRGTYGMCERCGQPIPEERLEAIPATRLCVTCKQTAAAQ